MLTTHASTNAPATTPAASPAKRGDIRGLPRAARRYDRARDLPALLPAWPAEIADVTYAGRLALLAKLRRALRIERKHGASGHWSYDLARHAALRNAYRCEVAALMTLRRN